MQKATILLAGLLLASGAALPARAQLGALVGAGLNARRLAKARDARAHPTAAQRAADSLAALQAARPAPPPAPAAPSARRAQADSLAGLRTSAYQGRRLRRQRTPPDQVPAKAAPQVAALEAELERCYAALQASPTAPLSTPEQQAALQQALIAVARAGQTRYLPVYQEEAAFYVAENARRQPAAPAR